MVNSDLFCPKPRNPSALGAKGLRCHQQSLKQLIACRKPRSFRTFRRRDSIPSHVLFVFCHRRTPSPGRRSQLLPPFLPDTSKVRSSIFLYERVSELASPVTGYSLPSNFPVHSLCVGFPVGSTPSIVIFTFSPAASITTVLFFGPPAPSFDLALFSFQVPIMHPVRNTMPGQQSTLPGKRLPILPAYVASFGLCGPEVIWAAF